MKNELINILKIRINQSLLYSCLPFESCSLSLIKRLYDVFVGSDDPDLLLTLILVVHLKVSFKLGASLRISCSGLVCSSASSNRSPYQVSL